MANGFRTTSMEDSDGSQTIAIPASYNSPQSRTTAWETGKFKNLVTYGKPNLFFKFKISIFQIFTLKYFVRYYSENASYKHMIVI